MDGAPCAIVAYDSGQSSFQMIMNPMPNMEVRSVGGSHYKGDIHIDLATRWPRKVTMDELVITESTVPLLPKPVDTVIERNTLIRNVTDRERELIASLRAASHPHCRGAVFSIQRIWHPVTTGALSRTSDARNTARLPRVVPAKAGIQ